MDFNSNNAFILEHLNTNRYLFKYKFFLWIQLPVSVHHIVIQDVF